MKTGSRKGGSKLVADARRNVSLTRGGDSPNSVKLIGNQKIYRRLARSKGVILKSKVATSSVLQARDEQARQLQSLGFTEYESRSLLALIERNPATAYEVARNAGLPRANVYAALDVLVKKGAVQPINQNPIRYVPVDPKIFLNRIASQTNELCRDLSQSLTALAAPSPSAEYVWWLSNLEQVRDKIREQIEQAERHVWIKGNIGHIRQCLNSLKSASERNVSIVIVLFGTIEDKRSLEFSKNIKVYLHEGTGTAVGMSDQLVSMTKDFESALTANFTVGGYGVYTQNIPVVVLVESLIRHEIYMAEIFKNFGREIEEYFGPSLMSLRKKFLPSDQFHSLNASIKRRNLKGVTKP
jgi:sugar-specific transcriptional regulator TrmB